MTVAIDSAYEFGGIPVLRTYACRIARQLLLHAKLKNATVESDPILAIEADLVEMAKARLQEFLLASFPDNQNIVRLIAIVAVKKVAASRITSEDIDSDAKKFLLSQLGDMSMEDLIPQVH